MENAMKHTSTPLTLRAGALAVRGALALLVVMPLAHAADEENDEVKRLTTPASSIEIGVGNVNHASDKFGEYNGLDKKGSYAVGGFLLQGGGAYDSDSALRWYLKGANLGLDTRSLDAEIGVQGLFRVNYNYDELSRVYSTQFQTFYDGAGTTTLSLPASFAATPAASRVSSTTTANGALSNWQNMQSPYATAACAAVGGVPTAACRGPGYLIAAAMHHFDVGTERKKHAGSVTVELSPQWQFSASAQRESKEGTKVTGLAFGGPARGVTVPELIDSTTDQFKAALAYVGEQGNVTFGYYGSLYKNAVNKWTVESPFNGALLNPELNNRAVMSGAPDNEMHRLSVSGGYNFTHTTRLTMAANYQRMTQNEALVDGLPTTWVIPTTSAHGKVINTSLNATLTSRPLRDLALSAVVKYENRDDQSPVYRFMTAGGDAAGAPSLFVTEPLNRRMEQVSLDADYAFARRQSIRFGVDTQEIRRTADGEETPFKAETNRENTLRIDYRNNLSELLTGRLGYSHAKRTQSEYETSELLPVPTVAPLPAADPLLPGLVQFYLADRTRDQLRSSVNIQATERLSLQTGVDYNRDQYKNSLYGLKQMESQVFKLDAAFTATDRLSYDAFYTFEHKKSEMGSLSIGRGYSTTILDAPAYNPATGCTGYWADSGHLPSDEGTDPCRKWTQTQTDRIHTVGWGVKATQLMGGKLDLGADLALSYSRTPIEVTGGYYVSNGNTVKTAARPYNNVWVAAESFPDVTSKMVDIRLHGLYRINNVSSLRANYQFRRLQSSDWQYDAYANAAQGVTALQVYPGNAIVSPNYAVQVVSLSYVHSF
ncbi:MtrB/PioB family decaheme-associated outer membrane protein [Pseudoduganella sp. FT26W]|uniref:MtrB/PioB family decaheme-associated outer membrane protein n=2 Tax=Duganella aquatilis TaxID=2666082 RepID=A0A844D1K1_9BURK|nr:MtrB/PioB family decaheme-associated outer membrane protein [Duganella aquatilis]